MVTGNAPEVGGIDEGGAQRIELRHEGIGVVQAAALEPLKSPRGRREGTGAGLSCHVGVAGGVHGDPQALIIVIAPKVGGVDEGGAGGSELRYEGVVAGEGVGGRLEGPGGRRKIFGEGQARHRSEERRVGKERRSEQAKYYEGK